MFCRILVKENSGNLKLDLVEDESDRQELGNVEEKLTNIDTKQDVNDSEDSFEWYYCEIQQNIYRQRQKSNK